MSLVTRLGDLITRTGAEFKAIRTLISGSGTGTVSALTTTATDLVGAINETRTELSGIASLTIAINDLGVAPSTVWSSQQITNELAATLAAAEATANDAVVAALEGEDLSDLADAVAANAANDLNLATAASVYTRAELGEPDTDLVALFNTAIA